MSLGSRVANLFSGTSNTQQDRSLGFVDDGLPVGKQTFTDVKLEVQRLGSDRMASQTDEEEARPPYIHVRFWVSSCFVVLLISIVYDCRRARRNHWRSFDALFRHCQNSTAR